MYLVWRCMPARPPHSMGQGGRYRVYRSQRCYGLCYGRSGVPVGTAVAPGDKLCWLALAP